MKKRKSTKKEKIYLGLAIFGVFGIITGITSLNLDTIIVFVIWTALFYFLWYKSRRKKRELKELDINAAGEYYYLDNIYKLATTNKEYQSKASTIIKNGNEGKRIFQYYFINKPLKLEYEPTNLDDPNAIKVIIAGEHVGYIPREDCQLVKNILEKHEIKSLTAFIGGGKYKIVSADGNVFEDELNININIRFKYV